MNSAVAEACLQIACTDKCMPNYVFVPSCNNLNMYNIYQGDLKQTYKGHFESLNCCIYNKHLNEIYTGSKDRNLLIWSPEIVEKNPFSTNSFSFKISDMGTRYEINSSANTQNSYYPSPKKRRTEPANEVPRDNWSDDE